MNPACPSCSTPCGAADRFCAVCGAALAVPSPPAPPTVAGRHCWGCGVQNPAGRDFCMTCGTDLNEQPPTRAATRMFEPVQSPAPKRRRRRAPALVALVGVVVLAAVAAGVLLTRGDDGSQDTASATLPTTTAGVATTIRSTTTARPTTTVAPVPVRIDPATITASASSTLPDEPPYSYGINLTLDGKPDTAWNDGAPGSGAGEKLTYRFSRPIRLTSIRLINGYATNLPLFQQNARLRDVVFVTDAGRTPFTLADVIDRQQFDAAFGRTTSLVIEVLSVYPGSYYEDLALSEIEFYGVPA